VRLDRTRDELTRFPESAETRYAPAAAPEAHVAITDWRLTPATETCEPYLHQPPALPCDAAVGAVPVVEERVSASE
jgi:hypothetical protein